MADFFSKIKKGLDKGTAIVSAKSSTLIETNKLKQDISTTNRMKKDTILELGTKVYTLSNEGNFSIESVQELITKIQEAETKVTDLEAKIKLTQDEEKSKIDELNKEEVVATATVAPVDVAASEVEAPATAAPEAAPAAPTAEPVAPVVAPIVVAEVAPIEDEEVSETISGEYKSE